LTLQIYNAFECFTKQGVKHNRGRRSTGLGFIYMKRDTFFNRVIKRSYVSKEL